MGIVIASWIVTVVIIVVSPAKLLSSHGAQDITKVMGY